MSLLKTNEIQNYNGSSLTLTASTVSTSAQLNTGGNISVTGSLNVSDDSTTRTNLGLGTIATQDSDSITVTGGSVTGTEIDLKSSGTTIFKSDGTTAVLSESGGNVTLGNATLANTFSLTDEYYLQGKVNTTYTTNDLTSIKKINFDGSTSPYWVLTGDTTNFIQGTTISDLKIIKAGIYLVNFCLGCGNTSSERSIENAIYGVGSGSTSILAKTNDNISYVDADTSYGSGTVTLVYKFNANDQISFGATSASQGDSDIRDWTHFNICLIRPL